MTKDKKQIFTLKISEDELKDRHIRDKIRELIDLKVRHQKNQEYVILSQTEYEVIKPHVVHWEKYAESKKELKYPNEVGKYNGKRLRIR